MNELPLANLVIAGVARGGTTSLYSYLAAHPEICGSRHKETEFFYPVFRGEPLPPLARYAEEFSECRGERYRMEATPGYLFGGEAMARTLDETLPGVRVVVMLREPVARALSFFTYFKSRFAIPKEMTFAEYVAACEANCSIDKAARAIAPEYGALHSGVYAEFLEPWLERFGERFLLTFSDELGDKPALMGRLCHWLALDSEAVDWAALRVFNPSAMYRGALLHRVALNVNAVAEPFFRRHTGLKERLARIYLKLNANRSDDTRPEADLSAARAFFLPHNARLRALLNGRGIGPLPPWLAEASAPAIAPDLAYGEPAPRGT